MRLADGFLVISHFGFRIFLDSSRIILVIFVRLLVDHFLINVRLDGIVFG